MSLWEKIKRKAGYRYYQKCLFFPYNKYGVNLYMVGKREYYGKPDYTLFSKGGSRVTESIAIEPQGIGVLYVNMSIKRAWFFMFVFENDRLVEIHKYQKIGKKEFHSEGRMTREIFWHMFFDENSHGYEPPQYPDGKYGRDEWEMIVTRPLYRMLSVNENMEFCKAFNDQKLADEIEVNEAMVRLAKMNYV